MQIVRRRNKYLLLLSYEYPFGGGETFLENELAVLAREFTATTILPTRAFYSPGWFLDNRTRQRTLPPGCDLLLPVGRNPGKCSITDFLSLFWHAAQAGLPVRGFFYSVRELFRDVLKAASLTTPLIGDYLTRCDTKSLVAYSYWKGPAAAFLCYSKQQGRLLACATRCHGGDLYDDILPFPYRPFEKFIAENCDMIMPVSHSGVAYLAAKGFARDRLRVARLGVKQNKKLSRCSSDGILRIASCANLIPIKRIAMLCAALANLNYPFHWVHFGDGKEREGIEALIKKFPSKGNAMLLGRINNSEVLSYYRKNPVDIFVNISSSEGVPVSIMEALMAGIPCIATDVGGSAEIVDSSCGQLLPADVSAAELTTALELVAANFSEWKQKRKAAFMRACKMCDAEKNYQEFFRILREI